MKERRIHHYERAYDIVYCKKTFGTKWIRVVLEYMILHIHFQPPKSDSQRVYFVAKSAKNRAM